MEIVNPIKDIAKIEMMKEELGKCTNSMWAEKRFFEKKRNRAIFCVGINSALRVSDIRQLNLKDVFNPDLSFINVTLKEQKTGKRKAFPLTETLKKELRSYAECYFYTFFRITINNINEDDKAKVAEIIETYPLFPSERKGYLSRVQIYRILNDSAEKVGIGQIGTHTMRKTFAYWFYMRTKDVALLQVLLNHSSERETLRYIGLTQDEIDKAYQNFGL